MYLKTSILSQLFQISILLVNAQHSNMRSFNISYTKILYKYVKCLWNEGIIDSFEICLEKKYIKIYLKYINNKSSLICLRKYKTLKLCNIITFKELLHLKQSAILYILYNGTNFYSQQQLIKQKTAGILISIFI